MKLVRCSIVLATILACSLAKGASLSLSSAPGAHLGTGAGGTCTSKLRHGQQIAVTCRDGKNVAVAKAGIGCVRAEGLAFCVPHSPDSRATIPGVTLTCSSGVAYFLSTGSDSHGRCKRHGDRMSCADTAGAEASASCAVGCEGAAASGLCCKVGRDGCPPLANAP